jgi:hypothetical protein
VVPPESVEGLVAVAACVGAAAVAAPVEGLDPVDDAVASDGAADVCEPVELELLGVAVRS